MDICDTISAWDQLTYDAPTSPDYAPPFSYFKALFAPYVHPDDKDADYVLSPKQYPWYYYYSHIKKPKAILEIGVRRGYSIISMCLGHKPVFVTLIDCGYDGVTLEHAIDELNKLGVQVDFDSRRSQEAVPKLCLRSYHYDLIHIDGEHTREALWNDLQASKKLRPDGWIIVDDVGDMPELLEVCKEFAGKAWDLVEVPTFRGHAVMRRREEPDRCVMDGGK